MKYYIVDEKKARAYLESRIITNDARIALEISFIAKGVRYEFDDYLRLNGVTPISKNVFAITTEGFVKWKNPARKENKWNRIEWFKLNDDLPCSNYICLKEVKGIQIKKENLVIPYENGYVKPEEANILVEENNDEISLSVKNNSTYNICVKQKDEIYDVGLFVNGLDGEKIIISKGTCFKGKEISVVDENGKVVYTVGGRQKENVFCQS